MRFALPQVSTRGLVGGAALVAFLMRFPGLMWPIRADEAGFTLVARAWHPEAESLYGTYWVDRPPPIIALVKLSDMVGGPLFIRLVAAVGCAVLVVAAARTAYLIAGTTAARWTAVATAAVTGNALIDSVSAKGEILGLPVVVTSFWFALEALRLLRHSPRQSLWLAAGAGFLGMAALGLKQNMATGLAFGGVVLLVSALRKDITWRDFSRLSVAALLGAAVPLGTTIAWCLANGVQLETLWYAVYGFRSHSLEVIAGDATGPPARRAGLLAAFFVLTGMAHLIGWFMTHLDHAWQTHAGVTAAAVTVLLVDGAGIVLGGSYWRPYLFGMVPTVVLCAALLVGSTGWPGRVTRWGVVFAGVSCAVALTGWVVTTVNGSMPPTEYYTGQAIDEVAEPDDTIVVYGGRADIVFASGLDSPYEHLWSLPMRVDDPDLEQLTAVLRSDRAPTWFVAWVNLDSWDGVADPELLAVLEEKYTRHGTACGKQPIWLLDGVDREVPMPDCDKPWEWWRGGLF